MTPVVRYSNYQLRATRGVGDGWALVGDAFGFVDPVLSSGLLIGLDGAHDARATRSSPGSPRALRASTRRATIRNLDDWTRIVDAYYSGRLFTLFKVGEYVQNTWLGRSASTSTSASTCRACSRARRATAATAWRMVDFMLKYGLAGNDPAEFAIR